MSKDEKSSINIQKRQVFEQKHHVDLDSPCAIGSGIIRISDEWKVQLIALFKKKQPDLCFFIPASGSGSRMFKFLLDYRNSNISNDQVEYFFENLENFTFHKTIPLAVREKISSLQPQYLAEYILNDGGMNYANLPKGLIPFHEVNGRIYNPFQEQVLQSGALMTKGGVMHFTVQEGFENMVQESIEMLGVEPMTNIDFSYSNQDKSTDAYCFNLDGTPFMEDDSQLRRPAGHGALISNLNEIDNDLILIKNIDNIQHNSKSATSNEVWESVIGLLLSFKMELKTLSENYSLDALIKLNDKYDFLSSQEIDAFDESKLNSIISRPSRVAGMVKNEGAPGGGPFWVNDEGVITKQIVEGVQISKDADQQEVLRTSSHFNPVFVALSKSDINGDRLDLNQFVDGAKNLVVTKPHKGNEIIYRELPGLWNGAMSNWNTLFVDIPAEVFSPVKTVLDLLDSAHQA